MRGIVEKWLFFIYWVNLFSVVLLQTCRHGKEAALLIVICVGGHLSLMTLGATHLSRSFKMLLIRFHSLISDSQINNIIEWIIASIKSRRNYCHFKQAYVEIHACQNVQKTQYLSILRIACRTFIYIKSPNASKCFFPFSSNAPGCSVKLRSHKLIFII